MDRIPEDPYRITDDVLESFLEKLSATGNIAASCRAAGVSRAYIYQRRQIDEKLTAMIEDAMSDYRSTIEGEIFRRAVNGVDKKLYHQGMPVLDYDLDESGQPKIDSEGRPIVKGQAFVRTYSDNLLLAHARRHIPEYNEKKQVDMKVTGLEGLLEEIKPSTGLPSEDETLDDANKPIH